MDNSEMLAWKVNGSFKTLVENTDAQYGNSQSKKHRASRY